MHVKRMRRAYLTVFPERLYHGGQLDAIFLLAFLLLPMVLMRGSRYGRFSRLLMGPRSDGEDERLRLRRVDEDIVDGVTMRSERRTLSPPRFCPSLCPGDSHYARSSQLSSHCRIFPRGYDVVCLDEQGCRAIRSREAGSNCIAIARRQCRKWAAAQGHRGGAQRDWRAVVADSTGD